MPTNRRRRTRKIALEVSDNLRNYLLTGKREKINADIFFLQPDYLRIAWDAVKNEILADWINRFPGTRPWAWWKFAAKKEPVCGWDYEQFDSAQRKRLGGTGTPSHEVLCLWGGFYKGIPKSWISRFEEEYFNGRALDIHGNRISNGLKKGHFKGNAIDPNDPPVFESEATYLECHGLLTRSEKKWLAGHPEAMDPEEIWIEER